MTPVIYADILFLYNFFMDSVILGITAKLINVKINIFKIAFGAVLGGVYSVFMFFPQLEILYSLVLKFIVLFGIFYLVFGGRSIHKTLKRFSVFMAVNFVLGGGIFALVFLTDFGVMLGTVVSGGEVYINLSPFIILMGICGTYAILGGYQKAKRKADYEKSLIKRIKIEYKGKCVELNMFFDTGCRISDPVSGKPAIIAEYRAVQMLLNDSEKEVVENDADAGEAYMCGLRVLPLSTVNGDTIIFGIVADRIFTDSRELKKITVGLAKNPVGENYNGIFNPEVLSEYVNEEELKI